jgi:hypothetical protein
MTAVNAHECRAPLLIELHRSALELRSALLPPAFCAFAGIFTLGQRMSYPSAILRQKNQFPMHTTEQRNSFLLLRGNGWSLRNISAKLNIPKSTLALTGSPPAIESARISLSNIQANSTLENGTFPDDFDRGATFALSPSSTSDAKNHTLSNLPTPLDTAEVRST